MHFAPQDLIYFEKTKFQHLKKICLNVWRNNIYIFMLPMVKLWDTSTYINGFSKYTEKTVENKFDALLKMI